MLRFHDNSKKGVKSIIWRGNCLTKTADSQIKKKKKEPARRKKRALLKEKAVEIKIFRNARR